MLDFFGNLASAGINWLTGSQNRDVQREANAQQAQQFAQNMAAQREFAQHGIRWKVEDAVSAGLHPLIGAGAQAQSFSPISVGGGAATADYGSMGQDIGRAISSMKTQDEKSDEITKAATKLALEKGSLENDLLRTKIRRLNSPGTAKGTPSLSPTTLLDGQPSTHVRTPAGAPIKTDDIKQQPDTAPFTARIRPAGVKLYTDKRFTDAEDLENRYGNVIEGLGGIVNLGADVHHSYIAPYKKGNPFDNHARRNFNRRFHFK